MSEPVLDCVIIGGGPAGLTAALYLTRFRRQVLLLDAGQSRASWIPMSHNQPSYPDGISGADLLRRMKQQAYRFGTQVTAIKAERVEPAEFGFLVKFADRIVTANTILLGTGVVNHRPRMDIDLHREAVSRGFIRYCPICDGFEAMDQDIGVLGVDGHGVAEALFLRTYSPKITLLRERQSPLSTAQLRSLDEAGIKIVHQPVTCITLEQDKILLLVESSATKYAFDTLYPALGSTSNNELAKQLGAAVSKQGCLIIDEHQMTTCTGVYAAGDVVQGLDQISVAVGQAAVAATAIHNYLRTLTNAG